MKIDIKELCNALGVEYDSAKSSAFYLHMVKDYRHLYEAAQQNARLTSYPPNHRDNNFCECVVCMGMATVKPASN
jgi:hypothetical protein